MPVLSRLVSVILRVGELVFASVSLYRLTTKRILTELQVVAGIVGSYLHDFDQRDAWPKKRFIYSEVILERRMTCSLAINESNNS